jgi:hypothetical protein
VFAAAPRMRQDLFVAATGFFQRVGNDRQAIEGFLILLYLFEFAS